MYTYKKKFQVTELHTIELSFTISEKRPKAWIDMKFERLFKKWKEENKGSILLNPDFQRHCELEMEKKELRRIEYLENKFPTIFKKD